MLEHNWTVINTGEERFWNNAVILSGVGGGAYLPLKKNTRCDLELTLRISLQM